MKTFSKFLLLLISIILLLVGMLSNIFAQDLVDDGYKRCIIQLKDSIDKEKITGIAKALSVKANASVNYIYKHSIKGFTINTPCHVANAVFGDSTFVKSMEVDSLITLFAPPDGKGPKTKDPEPSDNLQETSYGITRVGGSKNGTGLTAWIIDSGVDLDHPDLVIDTSRAFSVIKNNPDDENGHGTHVAGIIGAIDNSIGTLGIASSATIVPVRVLDRRGSGSVSGVIAGVDYVSANAKSGDCANMSLGGSRSDALDSAVIAASNKGIYFSLAAGNSSSDSSNYSPARANGNFIYTISAIDQYDEFAYYSNYGNPPIDYAAPGTNILSLWKNGGVKSISGTSMAAPHACAVLMLTNGNASVNGYVINDPDGNADPIISLGN